MIRIFVFLFFFLSLFLNAQKYNFINYSISNGLSGSSIKDIVEDQFGRIWFASENGGVTVYDGVNFEYITIDNHLPTNAVNDILEDIKGNIWIATNEGAVRYDGHSYELFNFEDGLSANIINCLFEDKKGNIWFGTQRGRACYWDGTTIINLNRKSNFSGESVRTICEDENGVLLGTSEGLISFEGDSFKPIEKYPGYGFGSVTSILIEGKRTWIGTLNGLNYIEDGKIVDFSLFNPLPSNIITSIAKDQQGRLWVGTVGSGLIRIEKDGGIKHITKENGIPSNYVFCITVDKNENVWVGTLSGGASKYGGDAFTYYTDESCLNNNFVYALLEDTSGAVWIGTGNGITIYEKGLFKQLNTYNGLADNQINTMIQDKNGIIWAGTYNGVTLLEGDQVIQNVGKSEGVNAPIVSLFEDNEGNIWLGSYGSGVFKWDGEMMQNYSMKSGLTNDIIFSINQDKKGRILLGTYGGGVNIIDNETISVINKSDGLPSNIVKDIETDEYGTVWFGTERGLVKWGAKMVVYDQTDGLTSSSIESILFDDKSSLWIGTGKGLDRLFLNPPQLERETGKLYSAIRRYNGNNGLIGIQIKRGACMLDKNSKVWFGTVGGAVSFNTEVDEHREYVEPRTYLKSVKIKFEDVDWSKRKVETDRFWNIPQDLSLDYEDNHISFSFVGIDMNSPKDVTYKWKLEGYDKEFTPLNKNKSVTYQQLPHGNYTFKLIACTQGDECNTSPIEYSFEIRPPFWKTTWFIVSVVIGIGFTAYSWLKYRESKFKSENEKLERIVNERTKEVVEKNEELEASNEQIVHQSQIIDEKNKEFNSSVRYAATIQSAFLPMLDELKNTFEESFVLYKPRDVVSGDFYWFKRYEDVFVVAAVDCTGHGVPGALMSMIGMTLLNGIVGSDDVKSPDQAMIRIDQEIKEAFEKSEIENKDGMDLALVAINIKENYLQYCGAQRPLFMVRDGKLLEYKANKVSIGGYYEGIKSFDYDDILFKKGDCIYIFSDGYQDQFGGPNDKKFKVKAMKDLIIKNSHLPMVEQEKIMRHEIESWMGDNEQTDDILVIGIRL